jgi:hypothetical protein
MYGLLQAKILVENIDSALRAATQIGRLPMPCWDGDYSSSSVLRWE